LPTDKIAKNTLVHWYNWYKKQKTHWYTGTPVNKKGPPGKRRPLHQD